MTHIIITCVQYRIEKVFIKRLLLKALLVVVVVFAGGIAPGSASQKVNLKNFPSVTLQEQAREFFLELQKQQNKKSSNCNLSNQELLQYQVSVRENLSSQYSGWSTENHIETLLVRGQNNFQTWLLYALLCRDQVNRVSHLRQQKNYKQKFVLVATNAYLAASSETERAMILELTGEVLLDFALKNRASKILSKEQAQEKLQGILANYPTTFAPYAIETKEQNAAGQVCIKWTHPFPRNTLNYKDFIEISPEVKDLGIQVKGSELCLQGLEFGQSYEIKLKPGLPGIRDLTLQTTETFAAYIPPGESMLAFRERGYVLPKRGPKILPLTTINVEKVKVKIISIPNRNLSQALNNGTFLQQIDQWQQEKFELQDGEMLWQGVFDISGKANRTVTTGLPLEEMLKTDLKPGLYVVQAIHDDGQNDTWQTPKTTQWFVISDLGLTTFAGPDGLHVLVRSLASATPLKNVTLSLVAKNNRVLQTKTTDRQGSVHFESSLIAGKGGNAPLLIQASTQDASDFSLLNLETSAHDMTDRGDRGRIAPKGLDAYVYSERDLYRPGETVHLVALLRDANAKAVVKTPLLFKVIRPDGREQLSKTVPDQGAGAHVLDFATIASSRTGSWAVLVYADVKAAPIGRFEFQLSDFVPPQIEVKLTPQQTILKPNEILQIEVDAAYLFGAPAKSLKVEGELTLKQAVQPFEKWKAYSFGLEEKSWSQKRLTSVKSITDTEGKAEINTTLPVAPDTTKMLDVEAKVTVHEISGRPRTIKTSIPFRHQKLVLGIAPQFKDRIAPFRGIANFNVIAVDANGTLQGLSKAAYKLYRENVEYTWFKEGSRWKYEPIVADEIVAEGFTSLSASKPTSLKAQVKGGRYRLEVFDPQSSVATSVRFRAGWGDDLASKRPDKIDLTLNQKAYKSGDKVEVLVKTPYSGELVLFTAGQTMKVVHTGKITEKEMSVTFPFSQEMTEATGTYLYATVFRPSNGMPILNPDRKYVGRPDVRDYQITLVNGCTYLLVVIVY